MKLFSGTVLSTLFEMEAENDCPQSVSTHTFHLRHHICVYVCLQLCYGNISVWPMIPLRGKRPEATQV